MDCVFCRIVKGELPADKVLDGEKVVAFLDVRPISSGHVLVLPKEHYELLTEVPQALAAELFGETHRLARAVVKAAGAEGFNLLQNNHPCAGQAVPHVHFHLIPRRSGDGIRFEWRPMETTAEERKAAAERIRAAL